MLPGGLKKENKAQKKKGRTTNEEIGFDPKKYFQILLGLKENGKGVGTMQLEADVSMDNSVADRVKLTRKK